MGISNVHVCCIRGILSVRNLTLPISFLQVEQSGTVITHIALFGSDFWLDGGRRYSAAVCHCAVYRLMRGAEQGQMDGTDEIVGRKKLGEIDFGTLISHYIQDDGSRLLLLPSAGPWRELSSTRRQKRDGP